MFPLKKSPKMILKFESLILEIFDKIQKLISYLRNDLYQTISTSPYKAIN